MNYNNKNFNLISSKKSSNEISSKYNNNTIISGIDTYGSKTDQSKVEKSYGHPTLSRYRCCEENPYLGTPEELLESEPASISGYGFAQYSDITKCNLVSEKNISKINEEIEENNINVDDAFDRKYREKEKKNRKPNLGKDVISYRIKSSKE
jgi:hypothetical protein